MLTISRITAAGWVIASFLTGVLTLGVVGISQIPANASGSNEIAARFGVEVVWTEDQCGTGITIENHGGCFLRSTPGVIYVSVGLDAETEKYVVLHEIGHVLQYRLGVPSDECAADQFARSMGARMGFYC